MELDKTGAVKRNISKNMTELRKAFPLTQAELAEKINYSDKAVSKWERGEGIPDVIVLRELADIYGVSIDYFLEDHTGERVVAGMDSKRISRTHKTITLVVIAAIWLLATVAFVVSGIVTDSFRGLLHNQGRL